MVTLRDRVTSQVEQCDSDQRRGFNNAKKQFSNPPRLFEAVVSCGNKKHREACQACITSSTFCFVQFSQAEKERGGLSFHLRLHW